ncbi:hypothetical protein EUX98_g614 [Antrodiella citrinella]|uniref:Transcription initiation factor IIF subunit alpha n=1 Tax=Antrodiella citrinella TaxID=2447956 RepID=A0A4S4NCF8_9APHY|nr:hypothetical protein EUX98_g614 [Antrodiella citrinella]
MPPSASVLFHPKKRPIASSQSKPKTPVGTPPSSSTPPAASQSQESSSQQRQQPNGAKSNGATPPHPSSPNKKPRLAAPRRKPDTEDESKPSEPEGPFSEFRLVSSALNGWKYDVMKFDSRKTVDILSWAQPVKLNRKDPFRKDGTEVVQAAPQAVGPMLGPDGKPVIGMDGRMVMVDANGRPIRAADANGTASANGSGGGASGSQNGKEKASKKKFQKKTRQVFLVPDEVRQLRREERYPWVLEDAQHAENWVGKMEEVAKSNTHAMFMPAANDVFKFVPAHRWYKFQKKPNHHILTLEEAETLMTQRSKNKDPERWLMRNRNGQAGSEGANVKSEGGMLSATQGASLMHSSSQSMGPGGRRLRTVDNGGAGGGLFGDDDDEEGGSQRRRGRELGAEGDLDELDFEEDFADDEEKVEADGEDEEAKEAEERLKKEYKTANKTREGYIDESDEEDEDTTKLSSSHKSMQKLIKKLDNQLQNEEDDDEADPYASGEEESSDEEEPPQAPTGPAIQPHEPKANSRASSQAPAGNKTPSSSQGAMKTESPSRATSPMPSGHGGHSVVAKRATSPKAPKQKTNGSSRATSPLAGGSRATSPVGSGAPGSGDSSASQAADGGKGGNKRKAPDEPTSPSSAGSVGVPSKTKKRKASGGEITQEMLVKWLSGTANATTKDCIQYFSSYLPKEDKQKKQAFADLVKEVATLKDGVLVLRSAYRVAAV